MFKVAMNRITTDTLHSYTLFWTREVTLVNSYQRHTCCPSTKTGNARDDVIAHYDTQEVTAPDNSDVIVGIYEGQMSCLGGWKNSPKGPIHTRTCSRIRLWTQVCICLPGECNGPELAVYKLGGILHYERAFHNVQSFGFPDLGILDSDRVCPEDS